MWIPFLPSLQHLSLINNPTCVQLLGIGEKYTKLVTSSVIAAIDKYAPLWFPSLGYPPQLELPLNKQFDPNIPTLLLPYYPLQCLCLNQSTLNDLVELVHRIRRDSPKHLRSIPVNHIWVFLIFVVRRASFLQAHGEHRLQRVKPKHSAS